MATSNEQRRVEVIFLFLFAISLLLWAIFLLFFLLLLDHASSSSTSLSNLFLLLFLPSLLFPLFFFKLLLVICFVLFFFKNAWHCGSHHCFSWIFSFLLLKNLDHLFFFLMSMPGVTRFFKFFMFLATQVDTRLFLIYCFHCLFCESTIKVANVILFSPCFCYYTIIILSSAIVLAMFFLGIVKRS